MDDNPQTKGTHRLIAGIGKLLLSNDLINKATLIKCLDLHEIGRASGRERV